MQEGDKRETADAVIRAMNLEVAQKRAQWQRDRETHRLVRMLSFSFLSLVILGALIVVFLFFSRAGELRTQQPPSAETTPLSRSSP